MRDLRLKLLIVLTLVGLVDTGYLLYLDFFSFDKTCLIGDGVACGTLSSYAMLFGIPYSLYGFTAYLIMYVLSLSLLRDWTGLQVEKKYLFFICLALSGFIFSSYLMYLSYFIIEAVCAFCFISWVLLLLISLLVCYDVWLLQRESKTVLW